MALCQRRREALEHLIESALVTPIIHQAGWNPAHCTVEYCAASGPFPLATMARKTVTDLGDSL